VATGLCGALALGNRLGSVASGQPGRSHGCRLPSIGRTGIGSRRASAIKIGALNLRKTLIVATALFGFAGIAQAADYSMTFRDDQEYVFHNERHVLVLNS
jgi:hypothetical protein